MWTAKITSKDYNKGILYVGVEYTDLTTLFTESIDMTGGSMEVLQLKIQTRLNTLNQTEVFLQDLDVAVTEKKSIELQVKEAIVEEPIP